VVNLVSSSIEPQTQVADPVLSSISPTLHQKSDTKVVDLFSSSVDPSLPLESDSKAVNLFPPIDPILPLENETQVVEPVSPSVDPIHPLRNTKVTDPVPSLVSPTLPLKSAKVVDVVFPSVDPIPPLRNVKVTYPVPSSVNPTLPMKSVKVVDAVSPSVDPIPPLRNTKVVDPVFPSVDPIPPLRNVKVVDLIPSSVNPTLPLKSAKVVYPSPPLVDPIQSSVDPTLYLESTPYTTHVFLVNIDSTMPEGIPLPLVKPPPSTEAILFDWGALTGPRLPSHIPFHITVQVRGQDVPQTLIDEGASVSILSSIAWYTLGCPQLAPVTQNLLAFNRRTSQPLGILPQFPVTLGGKTVFIDVMVVQDPLDFSLLLGWDYVYAMKDIVSTLFHVISFPHNGRIVTIDQLSFIGPDWVTSLSGSYMQTVSPPPPVNYVALSPMTSNSNDLDPIVDMVISSVGLLEPDLLTPVTTLDMCSFQSDSLPSDEDLLEAMTEFCPLTWYPSRALSSWKP
jgi:hypothetical protein